MTEHAGERPVVVVLYCLPLMVEAISSSLEMIADVRGFPALQPDPVGLLNAVAPDAVVVDHGLEAAALRNWAQQENVPLVHVRLRERTIRILRHGGWEESIGASTEAIRNVIAGALFTRHVVGS